MARSLILSEVVYHFEGVYSRYRKGQFVFGGVKMGLVVSLWQSGQSFLLEKAFLVQEICQKLRKLFYSLLVDAVPTAFEDM